MLDSESSAVLGQPTVMEPSLIDSRRCCLAQQHVSKRLSATCWGMFGKQL